MSNQRTLIRLINIAHFIDHYAMLIFASAVLVMAPALGRSYSELLPCASAGFIAFGAGSLLTGWLGDTWSRRHMMVVFFVGIGLAMIATGLVHTALQLALSLLAVGLFASIYHPVGTAMLVTAAQRLGHEIGINGVWGNVGVAFSALLTGVLTRYLGWRWAFILPGLLAAAAGIVFAVLVREDPRPKQHESGPPPRVPQERMWRVVLALAASVVAISTTFNAVTVAVPKLFAERLGTLVPNAAWLSVLTASVYLCGALSQYVIGKLIDRYPLKILFLPLAIALAPLLYLGAALQGLPLILSAVAVMIALFGQVTVNDAMVGRYTSNRWRARAYAVRYFVGFTAAGASVGAVAWLHATGGFTLLLRCLAGLCVLVVLAAVAFPAEQRGCASGSPAA